MSNVLDFFFFFYQLKITHFLLQYATIPRLPLPPCHGKKKNQKAATSTNNPRELNNKTGGTKKMWRNQMVGKEGVMPSKHDSSVTLRMLTSSHLLRLSTASMESTIPYMIDISPFRHSAQQVERRSPSLPSSTRATRMVLRLAIWSCPITISSEGGAPAALYCEIHCRVAPPMQLY